VAIYVTCKYSIGCKKKSLKTCMLCKSKTEISKYSGDRDYITRHKIKQLKEAVNEKIINRK